MYIYTNIYIYIDTYRSSSDVCFVSVSDHFEMKKRLWNKFESKAARFLSSAILSQSWCQVLMSVFIRSSWEHFLVGGLEHFFFPYIGNNHPNWLSYFSERFKPPTSHDYFHSTCHFGDPPIFGQASSCRFVWTAERTPGTLCSATWTPACLRGSLEGDRIGWIRKTWYRSGSKFVTPA